MIEKLINSGIIEIFIEIIQKDETITLDILETIELFMLYEKDNENTNFWVLKLLQTIGREKIEVLTLNKNRFIKQKSMFLFSCIKEFES